MVNESDTNLKVFGEYVASFYLAEHVVSEFESHRQHFVYLLLMIDGFFPENHHKRYCFGTYSKPNQNFLKKFLYFLDTIFYIDFGRTWYPTSLVLRIVSSIEVEQFFVGKEKPQSVLFAKVHSYPIRKFQSFCFMVFRKFWLYFVLVGLKF